jgi:hypothetical protein
VRKRRKGSTYFIEIKNNLFGRKVACKEKQFPYPEKEKISFRDS